MSKKRPLVPQATKSQLRPPIGEAETTQEWARGRTGMGSKPATVTRVRVALFTGDEEPMDIDKLSNEKLDFYIDECKKGLRGLHLFRSNEAHDDMNRTITQVLSCLQEEKQKRSEQV
jgi:hypothetical protein